MTFVPNAPGVLQMVIFATVIAAIVAFGAIADFYYRGRNVRACHDLWIATLVIVTCTPFLPYLSRQIAMPIHAPMIPTRVWSDSCDFRLTRSGHADEGQLVSDGRVKQRISTKNAVDAGGATDEESPPTVHPQATERLIDAASGSPTRVERATSVNDVVEMPLGARDWGKGLLATWVVGAAFQIIRTLLGLVRLRQTCRRAIPGDHFLTDEIWKEVSSAVQSGRKPALRICEAEAGPFVTGFFRPAIYVPKHLAKDTSTLRTVLIHELVHLRFRHQYIAAWSRAVMIVAWWHPACHYLAMRLSMALEMLCDGYVVRTEAPLDYAEMLLRLSRPTNYVPGALTMGMSRSRLRRRIERIVGDQEHDLTSSRVRLLLSICWVVLPMGIGVPVWGQRPPVDDGSQSVPSIQPVTPTSFGSPGDEQRMVLDAVPSDAVAMVHYNRVRDVEAATGFYQWLLNQSSVHDSSQVDMGVPLSDLLGLADDRRQVVVYLDGSTQRAVAIVSSSISSMSELYQAFVDRGYSSARPSADGRFLKLRRDSDGSGMAAACAPGICAISTSAGALSGALKLMDGQRVGQIASRSGYQGVRDHACRGFDGQATLFWFTQQPMRSANSVGPRESTRVLRPLEAAVCHVHKAFLEREALGVKASGGCIEWDMIDSESLRFREVYYAPDRERRRQNLFMAGGVPPAIAWLPADSTEYLRFRAPAEEILAFARNVLNRSVQNGFFDDFVESLRHDPNGPMVDIVEKVVPHLGREWHLAECSSDGRQSELVAAISLSDRDKLADYLSAITDLRGIAVRETPSGPIYHVVVPDPQAKASPPWFAISGDYLVVGSRHHIVQEMMAHHALGDRTTPRSLIHGPAVGEALHTGKGMPFLCGTTQSGVRSSLTLLSPTSAIGEFALENEVTSLLGWGNSDGIVIEGQRNTSSVKPSTIRARHRLTEAECVHLAVRNLANDSKLLTVEPGVGQRIVVQMRPAETRLKSESAVAQLVHEVSRAYWESRFWTMSISADRAAYERALQLWRSADQSDPFYSLIDEQRFFFLSRLEDNVRDQMKSQSRLAAKIGLPPGTALELVDDSVATTEMPEFPEFASFDSLVDRSLEKFPHFLDARRQREHLLAQLQELKPKSAPQPSHESLQIMDALAENARLMATMRNEMSSRLSTTLHDWTGKYRQLMLAIRDGSQKELAVVERQYREGITDVRALLDVQRRYSDREQSVIQLRVECMIAERVHLAAAGKLVERFFVFEGTEQSDETH